MASGAWATARAQAARLRPRASLSHIYAEAFAIEWEARRLFLWLPACAGAGVLLYLGAGHEPVPWMAPLLTLALAALAVWLRPRRGPFLAAVALAALFAGFSCAQWRSARVDAPVLDRIRVASLTGYVEEMDHRRIGSRFVLRLVDAEGLDPAHTPTRVRLTTRREDGLETGDFVSLKARLLPPAAASMPGGYAFARDAYFAGLGAVGSVLGRANVRPPPAAHGIFAGFAMAVDRGRNALAARVDAILGGDTGAIAAAMVTGKRDLLSDDGRDLIREAGIFHIITIAGVQMTLVAGLIFGLVRRGLALSPTLALRHPIKKWAALVAVYEGRERRREANDVVRLPRHGEARPPAWWRWAGSGLGHGRDLLLATMAATGATASFMAANFHELSPYVFIGNPLTLGIIEFFAVPGALVGALLFPLGLDGFVWHWVGAGIGIVLWAARLIAAAPASTLYLPAFAPWALPLLALAVLSAVIWRTPAFRLTAVPLLLVGLAGTMLGPRYDMLVMPGGEAVGLRGADGRLAIVGKGSSFSVEQWLRADGDGRPGAAPLAGMRCDKLACIAPLPGGQVLSLVADPRAFAEDCRRVDVIVTRLTAPASCGAALIIDRGSLAQTGALGLVLRHGGWVATPARSVLDDRPWSPMPVLNPPHRNWRDVAPASPADQPPETDQQAPEEPARAP